MTGFHSLGILSWNYFQIWNLARRIGLDLRDYRSFYAFSKYIYALKLLSGFYKLMKGEWNFFYTNKTLSFFLIKCIYLWMISIAPLSQWMDEFFRQNWIKAHHLCLCGSIDTYEKKNVFSEFFFHVTQRNIHPSIIWKEHR